MIQRQHARHRHILRPHGEDVGRILQPIEHRREQPARKHRGAQIADAFGIDRIVRGPVVRSPANRDGQVPLQPFAHFGALFARDGQQLGLIIRGERGDEAAMRFAFHRPTGTIGRWHGSAAQFDRRALAPQRQFLGRAPQRVSGGIILHQRPATNGKSGRGEQTPEQRRMDLVQWQTADDPTGRFRHQHQRAVVRPGLDRGQPARIVKRHGQRVIVLKCSQARIGRIDQPDVRRRRKERCVHAASAGPGDRTRAISAATTASIRPQEKSPAKRRSLSAMPSSPV